MVSKLKKEMRYRHLENSKQCKPGVKIVFTYGRKKNSSLKNQKRFLFGKIRIRINIKIDIKIE